MAFVFNWTRCDKPINLCWFYFLFYYFAFPDKDTRFLENCDKDMITDRIEKARSAIVTKETPRKFSKVNSKENPNFRVRTLPWGCSIFWNKVYQVIIEEVAKWTCTFFIKWTRRLCTQKSDGFRWKYTQNVWWGPSDHALEISYMIHMIWIRWSCTLPLKILAKFFSRPREPDSLILLVIKCLNRRDLKK